MKRGGIIVEGAEQVGKSTFCQKLREWLDLDLVHMHKDYGFVEGKFDYFKSYFHDIDKQDEPIVFDRHYVSELAYGRLFDRDNIDDKIKAQIETKLRDLGYIIVLLVPRAGAWLDREEMITSEQNELVSQYFDEAYEDLRVTKIKVNAFDDASFNKVIELYWRMP